MDFVMPDLIRHPEVPKWPEILDSHLRGNDECLIRYFAYNTTVGRWLNSYELNNNHENTKVRRHENIKFIMDQKSEVRGQRSEVGGQRSEVRGQNTKPLNR